MSDSKPFVISPTELEPLPGGQTSGMDRRQIAERDGTWVGWIRTEPGVASGWHHHGDHDSWICLSRGAITIEFGAGGRESITAHEGQVIVNPARLVHREYTGPDQAVEAYVIRIGSGPQNVNVDGPESA